MAIFADANLNALKDDKFWIGVHTAIDRSGRYLLWGELILIAGVMTIIGTVPLTEGLAMIGGLATAAGVAEKTLFSIPKPDEKK